MHRCKDTNYRCQYEDEQGRQACSYVGVIDTNPTLCPVCGEKTLPLSGLASDGRLIGKCGDAFLRPDETTKYL